MNETGITTTATREAPVESTTTVPAVAETATCCNCGREAAATVDGKSWCIDCWAEAGSCCAGDP